MDKFKVLIVDDEAKNIKLLKGMLYSKNYELYEALSGGEAIDLVHEIGPDLILLDIMMPGISGFEVCRQLKKDENTKMIPIVMVTALRENEYLLKAMESGADDFLSKPVDATEVGVRVKSLLRIKAYHDEIADQYREIAAKNNKLLELEKIKDGLINMIVHDLKNPLAAIMGYTEMVLVDKEKLTQNQIRSLEICYGSCQDLKQMIEGLLDIYKMEEGKMKLNIKPVNLDDLIDGCVQQFFIKAAEKQIRLSCDPGVGDLLIPIDPTLIKRVLANLLNNAIRHTPAGGSIGIAAGPYQDNGYIRIEVRDTGQGLAPEYRQKVFDKFEQVKLNKSGAAVGACGLGLAFCKLAVEYHGGRIWVESEGVDKGANFQFTLPTLQPRQGMAE